jgi:hypothetical protein
VIICDDIGMFSKDNPDAFSTRDQPEDQMCHHVSVQGLIESLHGTHFATTYPQYGHGVLVFKPLKKK